MGPTMPKYSGVKPILAPTTANTGKKPIQKIMEPGTEIYAYFVHKLVYGTMGEKVSNKLNKENTYRLWSLFSKLTR